MEVAIVSSNREWDKLYEQASEEVSEWRKEHPKATFLQIAAQVDEQLSRVRARMLEDMALASESARAGTVAKCPECGRELRATGKHKRKLLTEHDEQIALTRSYALCPSCDQSFFPPG